MQFYIYVETVTEKLGQFLELKDGYQYSTVLALFFLYSS